MTANAVSQDYQDSADSAEQQKTSPKKSKGVEGSTPRGKDLQIVRCPTGQGYYIQFTTGGALPRELEGLWTNYELAKIRVENYVRRKSK